MTVESGQRVALRRNNEKDFCHVVVIYSKTAFSLVMGKREYYTGFEKGDILEVSVPDEEGVYIHNAEIFDVILKDKIFLLLLKNSITNIEKVQRRTYPRKPITIKAKYTLLDVRDKKLKEGLIINKSDKGALLAAKEPLEVGSSIYITFKDPGKVKDDFLGVVGKIVRSHPSPSKEIRGLYGYYFGVEFDSLPSYSQFSTNY